MGMCPLAKASPPQNWVHSSVGQVAFKSFRDALTDLQKAGGYDVGSVGHQCLLGHSWRSGVPGGPLKHGRHRPVGSWMESCESQVELRA